MYRDLVDGTDSATRGPGPGPETRFRQPRDAREAERARVLGARLLVKQAELSGHPVSESVLAVARRPLPDRF